MDLRRLRVGEWIAAASAVALIVSLWLPWWEVSTTSAPGGASSTASAWEALSVVDALLAALAVLAIAVWAITAIARAAAPGVAAETLLTPFALAMSVVCAVRVLDAPDSLTPANAGFELEVAYGAWIALAATLGVLAGTLVGMRDERLGEPGRPTDQTGVPVDEPARVEKLPGPPAA